MTGMTVQHQVVKVAFILIGALIFSFSAFAEGATLKSNQAIFERVLAAAIAGDRQELAAFAQSGELDTLDAEGLSPVLHTVRRGRLDATQRLIDAGANVDHFDPELSKNVIDQTAFLLAGARGNLAALKILLAAGARTNIVNYYGGTALIPAAEKGHVDAVRLLLQSSSIDVNHVNKLGWTALMEAIVLSDGGPIHQQIVKLLLGHGADPTIPDRDGVTALNHAKSKSQVEIVQLLEAHQR